MASLFNFFAGDDAGKFVSSNSKWEVGRFFSNSSSYGKTAGGAFIVFLGVLLVLFGAWKLFRAATSPRGQSAGNWFGGAIALILGGLLAAGGWKMLSEIAGGGANTVNSLQGGTIAIHALLTTATKGLL